MDRRRFLSDSSFELSLSDLAKNLTSAPGEDDPVETARAAPDLPGHWSLWGRGALIRFAGNDTGVNLNGDVLTGLLGLDYARGRWLAGVGLSWSDGDGAYRSADGDGELDSTLLSVHPYLRYALTDRLSVWGVLGYGRGQLQLTPESGDQRHLSPDPADNCAACDVTLTPGIKTDLGMSMGALGLRGTLYASAATALALKSDLLWTSTASTATAGLAAATGDNPPGAAVADRQPPARPGGRPGAGAER